MRADSKYRCARLAQLVERPLDVRKVRRFDPCTAHMKDIVVLYHGNCLDGFAAAYAAWKKFGDEAMYVACYHGEAPDADLTDKEVYMVDFSYTKSELLAMEKVTKRLVVLDHHIGTKDAVEATQEHVFDTERSGTGIAWNYFHPDKKLPRILAYVQDNDLWHFALLNSKEIAAYLSTAPFEFEPFDATAKQGEDDEFFAHIVEKGKIYGEYFDYMCGLLAKNAEEVQFGEYRVLAVNAPRFFRSELGHALAMKQGPFAIVWYPNHGRWHFSLRGDGSIDLSQIANKRGGSGNRNAASFTQAFDEPLPFTRIKK